MCGHVGVAGDLTAKAMKAFKDMLFFDTVRGAHGTGVATIPWAKNSREPDDCIVLKAPVAAPVFLEIESVKSLLRNTAHSVVIGHNRHATKGAHVFENTHPFLSGSVVGAHNGTVRDTSGLPLDGDWGTDSETIMANIAENGSKGTITKLTEGTNGAWALVWYDFNTNELCFLRNSERPLCFAFSKDREQLFWSSEVGTLFSATSRNGLDMEKSYHLPLNKEYRWAVPAAGQKFGEPDITTMKGKKQKVWSNSSSNFYGGRAFSGHSCNRPNNKPSTSIKSDLSLPASLEFVLAPYQMTESEVLKAFSSGSANCCHCGTKVAPNDADAIALSSESLICGGCAEDAKIAAAYEKFGS